MGLNVVAITAIRLPHDPMPPYWLIGAILLLALGMLPVLIPSRRRILRLLWIGCWVGLLPLSFVSDLSLPPTEPTSPVRLCACRVELAEGELWVSAWTPPGEVLQMRQLNEWIGFSVTRATTRGWKDGASVVTARKTIIGMPAWFVLIATVIAPATVLTAQHRIRRRHRPGHCRKCGYDLRATPLRCPECGEAAQVDVDERERSTSGVQ